jgi:SAM-dependent methyltransferase
MHASAMENGKDFFDAYSPYVGDGQVTVAEVGSQNVNGSLRDVCPTRFEYVGLDFAEGNGVDVILDDPYRFPLSDQSVDIVVSSSCFEHAEMFWLTFLEIMRVLKPSGIFYLNAPSAGSFHRYPVDCWRFYPDSGKALIAWGRRNGISCELLESYVHLGGSWQDFISVTIKDASFTKKYPRRIIDSRSDFVNGHRYGTREIEKYTELCQNESKIQQIRGLTDIEY